jgi:hypothetical protein
MREANDNDQNAQPRHPQPKPGSAKHRPKKENVPDDVEENHEQSKREDGKQTREKSRNRLEWSENEGQSTRNYV